MSGRAPGPPRATPTRRVAAVEPPPSCTMRQLTVETEKLAACPDCGGGRLRAWCRGRDRQHGLSGQEFQYSECRECGLVFLSLRPLESEAGKFYPEDYGPYRAGDGAAPALPTHRRAERLRRLAAAPLRRLVDSVNHRAARLFPDKTAGLLERRYRPAAAGLRLLDFGCGSEVFLDRAARLGWETVGLDFSEAVVRRVAERGHEALLMSPAVWDEIADESLDFVRLSHVLEHLYAPREVLGRLRGKMKPGASLHVAVPNPMSITSRLFRSRWFGLECPRHINLYSPKALRRALRELGFTEIEEAHEVVTKDFARSLGYLLSDTGRMGRAEAEGLMHRDDLARLLQLPARVAAASGLSDRFHVFARKPAR